MYTVIMSVHIFACFMLIMLVLVQPSKGGGFAIFGGGGDALFSASSGTSFMKKATGTFALTFAATSLLLTILSTRVGLHSVTGLGDTPAPPAAPAAAPANKLPTPVEAAEAEAPGVKNEIPAAKKAGAKTAAKKK